jgi:hypothetical protein
MKFAIIILIILNIVLGGKLLRRGRDNEEGWIKLIATLKRYNYDEMNIYCVDNKSENIVIFLHYKINKKIKSGTVELIAVLPYEVEDQMKKADNMKMDKMRDINNQLVKAHFHVAHSVTIDLSHSSDDLTVFYVPANTERRAAFYQITVIDEKHKNWKSVNFTKLARLAEVFEYEIIHTKKYKKKVFAIENVSIFANKVTKNKKTHIAIMVDVKVKEFISEARFKKLKDLYDTLVVKFDINKLHELVTLIHLMNKPDLLKQLSEIINNEMFTLITNNEDKIEPSTHLNEKKLIKAYSSLFHFFMEENQKMQLEIEQFNSEQLGVGQLDNKEEQLKREQRKREDLKSEYLMSDFDPSVNELVKIISKVAFDKYREIREFNYSGMYTYLAIYLKKVFNVDRSTKFQSVILNFTDKVIDVCIQYLRIHTRNAMLECSDKEYFYASLYVAFITEKYITVDEQTKDYVLQGVEQTQQTGSITLSANSGENSPDAIINANEEEIMKTLQPSLENVKQLIESHTLQEDFTNPIKIKIKYGGPFYVDESKFELPIGSCNYKGIYKHIQEIRGDKQLDYDEDNEPVADIYEALKRTENAKAERRSQLKQQEEEGKKELLHIENEKQLQLKESGNEPQTNVNVNDLVARDEGDVISDSKNLDEKNNDSTTPDN